MYNNYTIQLLNPDKISTRQAEAAAQRRAAEGHVRSERTFRAPASIERIVAFGASRISAVRRWAGQAGAAQQPLPGPRHAAGQPRA